MWSLTRLCSTNTNFSLGGAVKWRLCSKTVHDFKSNTNIGNKGYHFPRRKVQPAPEKSNYLYVKVGLAIATGCSLKAVNFDAVFCESQKSLDSNKSRLVGVHTFASEPEFKWSQLYIFLKPHLWKLIGAVIAAVVCALLNIQIPIVLGSLIDVLTAAARSSSGFFEQLKTPALKVLSLYTLHSVFTFIYIALLSNVGEGMAKAMKVKLFSSILDQDIAFFDEYRTGELLNRLTVDINDFKSSFKMIVSQGLRNSIQIVGCAITLFYISPHMTGAMMVAVPSIILAGTLMGSMLRKISFQAKAQCSKVTLIAEEALSNLRTVRAFAMEDLEKIIFNEQADLCMDMNITLGHGIALFQAGTNLFLNGMVLTTIYMGGYMLVAGSISGGDVMAFLVAVQMLQRSFAQLSILFGTYIKGKHAGARVFEMLDLKTRMPLKQGKIIPYHSFIPTIEFKNVKFAYPSRPSQLVLDNFSLKIPVGKTVAIVGSSGSGKSTVAWLVERFYDVNGGSVLVGGEDVRQLNPTWLRGRAIGFISQEPVLFATSVMENIRYGQPNATDKEVIEAAKLANADLFIREFPEGYKTLVGERGTAISGGQKQRIAIARALLKNPSILILDEATSALDTESEQIVQKALDDVTKSRTTIVIAHRLSTVKNADLIVVMSQGRIVETGTHDELMNKNGMYASLVFQQQLSDK